MRRGSSFSRSSTAPNEPKTFTEKFKSGIRRRLRSKPKPVPEVVEDPIDPIVDDATESKKPEETGDEPVLKGSMSFFTLKRIMLMRKRKKGEVIETKSELKDTQIDVANEMTDEPLHSGCNFGKYLDFEGGAIADEQITIENEKSSEIGDCASILGSSSIYSEAHVIMGEIKAEVNHVNLSVCDREKNPSSEFGEVV